MVTIPVTTSTFTDTDHDNNHDTVDCDNDDLTPVA